MPSHTPVPSLIEPPPSRTVLRIEGLCVCAASGAKIVDDITLELERGEVLGLIGESGAGKSTIGLAALCHARGRARITAGRIELGGTDLRSLDAAGRNRVRGIRIAYVAQSAAAAFNPATRLMDQVCEGPVHHGLMTRAAAERRAIMNFRALGLPDPERFGSRFPHQVSGGQLQRAMAVMAMSCGPEVLVLDEPTTALDVTTQIDFLAHLKKLIATAGTAALYISHDLALVAQIADRILVLRDGKSVETGRTQELLTTPRTAYARALIAERDGGARMAAVPGSTECLLAVRDLTVSYAGHDAVKAATLSVARGETVAVIGESGSGKTSLAYAVCGLVAARIGRVTLGSVALAANYQRRSREQLRRIQLVFQLPDVALNPRQRVAVLVGRPVTFYFGTRGAALGARVSELLREVGLDPALADRHPDELSGGQKQRVCIARALAARPDLLVCDEVTAALDPLIAVEILELLRRLQEDIGVSCLFITHDLGTVRRIAHRVVVMLRGQIVAQGPTAAVFGADAHHYVAELCAAVPEMRAGWLEEVLERRETQVQSGLGS
jgi:peptide/nickel transport system ATP-binding protein